MSTAYLYTGWDIFWISMVGTIGMKIVWAVLRNIYRYTIGLKTIYLDPKTRVIVFQTETDEYGITIERKEGYKWFNVLHKEGYPLNRYDTYGPSNVKNLVEEYYNRCATMSINPQEDNKWKILEQDLAEMRRRHLDYQISKLTKELESL